MINLKYFAAVSSLVSVLISTSSAFADRADPGVDVASLPPIVPANVEADTVEEKQRSVELRVLGAIDRATGVRINTGASGERFEQWNDSGRFHIHPEELKMQQAIRNQVEEMFDEDDRD